MIIIPQNYNSSKDISEIDNLIAKAKEKEKNYIPRPPSPTFTEYSSIYSNTTEDITKVLTELKNFLTICGSGDQVFNAISYGAENITTFDINSLCRYALSLKEAAIQRLSRKEIINFYINFDKDIFNKIIPYLTNEDLKVWSYIFDNYSSSEIAQYLFKNPQLEKTTIIQINPYLKGTNYSLVKEKIKNSKITFINTDLFNIPNWLKDHTFDGINLSNIYEYLNFGFDISKENAANYINFINTHLFPLLNENGFLIASYLYAFNNQVNDFVQQEYYKKTKKIFTMMQKEINHQNLSSSELELIKKGFTAQNIAYMFLYELLKKQNITLTPTNFNVKFGRSTANTDAILTLKK